jgi:hypothetical protein
MKKKTILEIITVLFVFLFAYTACSKFFDPDRFKRSLAKSPLIAPFKDFIALGIPSLELAIVFLLIVPRTRRIGILSFLTLMVTFTLYIGYMMAFSPKLPCSCGGVIALMSWKMHLFFNTAFIGLASWALWLDRKSPTNQTSNSQPLLSKGYPTF